MHVMNGALIRNRTITVRYYEPIAQDVFWSHFSSIGTPPIHRSRPNSPESESTSGRSSPEVAAQNVEDAEAERRRQEDIAQAIREAAERREKEAAAAAKEAAEAKAKKQEERRRRKEEAERAEAAARQALDAAMAEETSAGLEHMEARVTLSEVNSEMLKARMTCVEAKKAWENAEKVHAEVEKRLNEALGSMEEALQKKLLVQARRKAIEKEDREQETDEETLRQAELAESIRKMQELRLVEEAEREEREKRQREAALAEEERLKREREARAREVAERLAREREEAERMAREQREREEQQKRDAENRQRLYEQAAATERVRCQGRDLKFIFWNDQRALERFLLVSDEFDSIKFEESRPLIFENVPWPVLDPPYCQIIASIEWGAVEKFFNAMEKLLRNDKEYKALLEKTHRRFHPDKWRARGILNSVPDQGLRDRLEAAGNIVAQAITPLWRSRR
ncbi:hypothetical protein BC835DRAFT_690690 [Cytidiella melzeri]|nr:hypothetical protein BC835DRAFT_690690 [Cytidiella melzeri]